MVKQLNEEYRMESKLREKLYILHVFPMTHPVLAEREEHIEELLQEMDKIL